MLFFRCPMPYKLAEDAYPGTMDEKLGSEVGAYSWMQLKCSEIRIPHLYGFGFMGLFEEQERKITVEHDISLTRTMNDTWESKGVWFWHSLASVNALPPLIRDHLGPKHSIRVYSAEFEEIMSKLWCENSEAIVEKKVADLNEYDKELRRVFGEPAVAEPTEKGTTVV
jgi:hypothetical protein